jgi:hypothetical protein
MAFNISWYIDGRVVLVRLSGTQTPEDARHFDEAIRPYLDNAEVPLIHFVFDTTGLVGLPGLGTLARFQWTRHPKTGWVVGFPKPNPVVAMVTTIAAQLFKARFRTFDSIDATLTFLQSVDSTLPNLRAGTR